MFYHGFPHNWSTLKKLIWLRGSPAGGALGFLKTVTGALIHILDGLAKPAVSLEVDFSPIQDLHGYDNPWPAGGGVNKFPPVVDGTYSDRGVTVVAKNGVCTVTGTSSETGAAISLPLSKSVDISPSTSKIAFLNSFAQGSTNLDFQREGNTIHWRTFTVINRVASGWTDTGNEVIDSIQFRCGNNITYNGTFSPMLIALSESDPPTFAPYSNICPISGWTGVDVYVTGKNLFDKDTVTFVENKYITADGTIGSNNNYSYTEEYIPVAPSTGYKLTGRIVEVTVTNSVAFYDINQAFISRYQPNTGVNAQFTTPSNCYYIRFNASVGSYKDLDTIQLELGTVSSDYEPYTGHTYSVTWQDEAGTVYGGTIDLTTGVLTALRASKDYDGSNDEGWTVTLLNTGVYRAQIYISANMKDYGTISSAHILANMAKSDIGDVVGNIKQYGNRIWFYPPTSVTSEAELRTFLGNNNLQVCYELATPVIYQLTPTQVDILLGENNLFSTGDTMTLQYYGSTPPTP